LFRIFHKRTTSRVCSVVIWLDFANDYRSHIDTSHRHASKCDGCGQSFTIPKDLRRHLQTASSCEKDQHVPLLANVERHSFERIIFYVTSEERPRNQKMVNAMQFRLALATETMPTKRMMFGILDMTN
jgi:hypothetical protein